MNDRAADAPDSKFTLGSQTRDNVFWSMTFGVPIWTAYEVLLLWAYANGMIPLDKWFGSFHDGSPEAHKRMLARRKRRGV